jgi:hypothetical protein
VFLDVGGDVGVGPLLDVGGAGVYPIRARLGMTVTTNQMPLVAPADAPAAAASDGSSGVTFSAVTVWYSDGDRLGGAERGAARALLEARQDVHSRSLDTLRARWGCTS